MATTTATRELLEARIEKLEKKLPEVVKERDELKKKLTEVEPYYKKWLESEDAKGSFEVDLEDAQGEIERLKAELLKANDHPLLRALNDYVEERIKLYAEPMHAHSAQGGEAQQSLTLDHVTTTIKVKEEKRDLPTESTLTTKGKLIELVAAGKLESKKEVSEIVPLLPEGISRQDVSKCLSVLVDQQVLMKSSDTNHKHIYYQRHPDVQASISK